MGKLVNVVLSDGKTVAVDEEVAARLQPDAGRRQTDQENEAAAIKSVNAERSSGFHEGAKAAAEGFFDTLTGGAFGKVAGALSPDWKENMQVRGEERAGSRLLGEGLGFALPFAGAAGKAISGATAVGLTERAGAAIATATGSKGLGRLAEGALFGVQGAISRTNVTGDPLTIAGTLEDAGMGAVLNWGIAKLGDKVLGAGNRAQTMVDQAKALEETKRLAAEGEGLFSQVESYKGWKTAHADSVKAAKANNTAAAREAKARAAATHPGNLRKAVDMVKKARAEVQAQLASTPAARAMKAANRANATAEREFTEAADAFTAFRDDSETVNKAFRDIDEAIKELEKRPGGTLTEADEAARQEAELGAQLEASQKAPLPKVEEGELPFRTRKGDGVIDHKAPVGKKRDSWGGKPFQENARPGPALADAPAPPASASPSKSLGQRLKEFRQRRSQAAQKLGSWDGKANRWTMEEGKVGNPDEALRELADLRDDIASQFPTGRKKALPDIPRMPEKPTAVNPDLSVTPEDAVITQHLAGVSRELGAGLKEVDGLIKAGDYEGAANLMQTMEARARSQGMGDLVFPKFPKAPRPTVPVNDVQLPKSLEEFARIRSPEKIEKLAMAVDENPALAESFGQMVDDLGLRRLDTAGETLRAVHGDLKGYIRAMDALEGAARPKRTRGIFDKIGDTAKGAVRYAAQRGVDVGGWKGAAARTFVGAGVGYAMDGVEGAYVGGALLSGKLGVRNKISALVAKVAPRVGRGLHGIAPVSSYLQAAFPSGERDEADDLRSQAHRRIGDILQLQQVAPDAAYLAVEDLLGHPGDVAHKMHSALLNAVNYLAETAPRDPGIDVTLSGSNWRPSAEQSLALAHRIEAVVDPLTAIARTVSGDGHPAATEALWVVHGPLMEEYAQEFMLSDRRNMTAEAESRMAKLLRVQTGLQQPAVLASLQGLYLPQPAPAGQPSSSPGTPGRPPAVRSEVAGSSVQGLLA